MFRYSIWVGLNSRGVYSYNFSLKTGTNSHQSFSRVVRLVRPAKETKTTTRWEYEDGYRTIYYEV